MDLYHHLTPAVLAYKGIQYQYMAPGVFTDMELEYIQQHLRILSGFYGILRPFDGVTPYRLEMQANLSVGRFRNLYEFWGNAPAGSLTAETECIVNLASKEYSLCISQHLPEHYPYITVVFAEIQRGKLIEKGTMCKMARGEMVRYLAQNQVTDPEGIKEPLNKSAAAERRIFSPIRAVQKTGNTYSIPPFFEPSAGEKSLAASSCRIIQSFLKSFTGLGYQFAPECSDRKTFTFLRKTGKEEG